MPATRRPAPIGVKKRISIREFFSSTKRKKIGLGVVLVLAAIGTYVLFFVGAAPNNCSPVEGGGICDINQAANKEGTNSIFSLDAEVQNKINNEGWQNQFIPGVPFRAPNFPQNGAQPLWRFYRDDITAHFLALEGTAEYNNLLADAKNVRQGIIAYAWPDGRQPGTVPIHRAVRGALYFLTIYTDNQGIVSSLVNGDKTWSDGGVNFWAYPSNYFPPVPTSTPTKDTDCANQNITVGDKGACVQTLKGILNGYVTQGSSTTEQLDINNNTFDSKAKDYTSLFVLALKSKGVQAPDFGGTVTKEIWAALEAGYPASGRAVTGSEPSAQISPCPQGGGDTEAGLKEYIDGVAAGKKYDTDCHTFWLTYAQSKKTSGNLRRSPVPTPAVPSEPQAIKCPSDYNVTLEKGTTSKLETECIKAVQAMLIAKGYKSIPSASGEWNNATTEALRDYIRNSKLERDCRTLSTNLASMRRRYVELFETQLFVMKLAKDNKIGNPTIGALLRDAGAGRVSFDTNYNEALEMINNGTCTKDYAATETSAKETYYALENYSLKVNTYVDALVDYVSN